MKTTPVLLPFTKMEGIGNDYVYVSEFTTKVTQPEKLSRHISDRNFGVGGDGLVLIGPSNTADFRMRIFNADGSEAEMCGNASRCVGKYVYENGLTSKEEFTLETLAGIKILTLTVKDGSVVSVRVNMGKPILTPADIPMNYSENRFINQKIIVQGISYHGTAVSMGNPHLIIFVSDVDSLDLSAIGPYFENHQLFPKRTNTEFVQIIDKEHVKMRVWERGSGETLACGTGACATLVACSLNGHTGREASVALKGGSLDILWSDDDSIFMIGKATTVFTGNYILPSELL